MIEAKNEDYSRFYAWGDNEGSKLWGVVVMDGYYEGYSNVERRKRRNYKAVH